MESIVAKIQNLSDLNALNLSELNLLNEELRGIIKETAYERGGHLASALGAVECITALCKVYNFEKDKIVFDVGHQSYAYKILSVGKERFSTLRSENGESGFPDGGKNEYFIGGHAGNSISAGLGYCTARDLINEDYSVVCFVGDASFFNGENLEALFASEKKPKNFVIIFNDNGMSISKNENGAYKFFTKMSRKKGYKQTKKVLRKMFGNNAIGTLLRKLRSAFKRSLSPSFAMEAVGLKYYGVFDGHDLPSLVELFKDVKQSNRSAFIHLKTVKGRGYEPAENSSEKYHGVSSGFENSVNDFSEEISPLLCELAESERKIVAVTAGMKSGTGLSGFAEKYPERFFDVGICEDHAVTFASGMALGGLKPIVCIYSTFLQRSIDQIITDACMQKAPVVFLLDRAGFVGSDGRTHQGLFDISYLSMIPNLTVLCPKDRQELKDMLKVALSLNEPVAIRYPNGKSPDIGCLTAFSMQNKWEVLKEGSKLTILAVGPRLNALALKVANDFGGQVGVVNARCVKPVDEDLLKSFLNHDIIVLEENMKRGGFGEFVGSYLATNGFKNKFNHIAVNDRFVTHATVKSQLQANGFSEENLKEIIKNALL